MKDINCCKGCFYIDICKHSIDHCGCDDYDDGDWDSVAEKEIHKIQRNFIEDWDKYIRTEE